MLYELPDEIKNEKTPQKAGMGRSPARPEGGRHERSSCVSAEPKRAAPPPGACRGSKRKRK